MTLVELKFVRKSMQVFHRLATQGKSTQVDRKSFVYVWKFSDVLRLAWTCQIANPFVHPSLVHPQFLSFFFFFFTLKSTCIDLEVRLARLYVRTIKWPDIFSSLFERIGKSWDNLGKAWHILLELCRCHGHPDRRGWPNTLHCLRTGAVALGTLSLKCCGVSVTLLQIIINGATLVDLTQ